MEPEKENKKKLHAEEYFYNLTVSKSKNNIPMKYMICVVTASVAEEVTNSLYLTKTRWEIDILIFINGGGGSGLATSKSIQM